MSAKENKYTSKLEEILGNLKEAVENEPILVNSTKAEKLYNSFYAASEKIATSAIGVASNKEVMKALGAFTTSLAAPQPPFMQMVTAVSSGMKLIQEISKTEEIEGLKEGVVMLMETMSEACSVIQEGIGEKVPFINKAAGLVKDVLDNSIETMKSKALSESLNSLGEAFSKRIDEISKIFTRDKSKDIGK